MSIPLPLRVVLSVALPVGLALLTYFLTRQHYGGVAWAAAVGIFIVTLPVWTISVDRIHRALRGDGETG